MSKIEDQMVHAVMAGEPMANGNTVVSIVVHKDDGRFHSAKVHLHGHFIAHYYWNNELEAWLLRVNDAGYRTRLTKSRLNAILKGIGEQGGLMKVFSRDGMWLYAMGSHNYKWEGEHLFYAKPPTAK